MNLSIPERLTARTHTLFLLLVALLCLGVIATSCNDTPVEADTEFVDSSQTITNFNTENFDAKGTIQGTVIDKGSGDALEDVEISLLFEPEDTDEPEQATVTTNGDGEFAFTEVPANSDGKSADGQNSPYTLKINASELNNYREEYMMNAQLSFESTGGDGAAENLVSDVTVPLSKQAVEVEGKLLSELDEKALADVDVEIYQQFNPIINGDEDTETDLLLDATTTDSDGSFSFSNVEEDAQIYLKFTDDSDPTETVEGRYPDEGTEETPSSDGNANPSLDIGTQSVELSNNSGAFYIDAITPEDGADMHPDSLEFVFEFNRAVDDNEYTRTDLGFGNGTFKDDIEFTDDGSKGKAPGDLEFDVKWSDGRETLTISPEGMTDATEYNLDVSDALDHDKFTDEHGNNLTFGSEVSYSDPNDALARNFSTNANNAKPHTPVIEVDTTNSTADFFNGGIGAAGGLSFEIEVDESDVEVKEYEVWMQHPGEDTYEHTGSMDREDIDFNKWTGDIYPVYDEGIYGSDIITKPLAILRGTGNRKTPDGAATGKVKVRAISSNLQEGDFSNEVILKDVRKPELIDSDCYFGGISVDFNEPFDREAATDPDNYTFRDSNGDDMNVVIEEVNLGFYYLDENDIINDSRYSIDLEVDNNNITCNNGESIEVSTDVTDLAGNPMDDTDEDGDGDDNTIEY